MPDKLFEINAGGALYWLGASNAEEALENYQRWIPDAQWDDPAVREVKQEEAGGLDYVDENGHRLRSMWEQFQLDPEMIACSEM